MADLDMLLEAVQQVAREVPSWGIDALCEVLNTTLTGKPNRNALLRSVTHPENRASIGTLFDCWQKDFASTSSASLALAIRSASYGQLSSTQGESQALVWTGPTTPGLRVRRTDQALLEVIQSAQHDLLLVTFAAYKVPLVVVALEAALLRGVGIKFVAESISESNGKVSFDAVKIFGPGIASRCQIFVWPQDMRLLDINGKHGSLHAKCAVADRSVLLLSSANLTEYALSLNMEMGLLIRGGELPGHVIDTFQHLIFEGTLKRLDP